MIPKLGILGLVSVGLFKQTKHLKKISPTQMHSPWGTIEIEMVTIWILDPPLLLLYVSPSSVTMSPCLGEWNGIEKNENNNFREFFSSLIWEF